jgi:hypothetical protein
MSSVIIKQNDEIERAIIDALEQVGVESLVRGKIVGVKPQ